MRATHDNTDTCKTQINRNDNNTMRHLMETRDLWQIKTKIIQDVSKVWEHGKNVSASGRISSSQGIHTYTVFLSGQPGPKVCILSFWFLPLAAFKNKSLWNKYYEWPILWRELLTPVLLFSWKSWNTFIHARKHVWECTLNSMDITLTMPYDVPFPLCSQTFSSPCRLINKSSYISYTTQVLRFKLHEGRCSICLLQEKICKYVKTKQ